METKRPAESAELVADGLLPVQSFVTRAVPLPPGTPAKPRPDRPASAESGGRSTQAAPPAKLGY